MTRKATTTAGTAFAIILTLAACEQPEPAADAGAATSTDTVAVVAPTTEGALLDPNEAAEEQLRGVEGLDSAAVALIVDNRPYPDMLALDRALSARIDSAGRADLYRRVFIPLDLNNASREEILLIPGVGPRMAHEFEEYRPYEGGMAEFRREIGKYVDDDEVERLARYVTVR